MEEFLNDNWKEVYSALSPPITETLVQVALRIMNGISSVVPFDEAFPEHLP
jgi:hypothetical protein